MRLVKKATKRFISAKLIFVLVFCFLCLNQTWALEESTEYEVKAGFLYNFARFITWPEKAFLPEQKSLRFCFVDKNPFGNVMEGIKKRSLQGRPIELKTIQANKLPGTCQLIFFTATQKKLVENLLSKNSLFGHLIVTENRGLGMINFFMKDDQLRFEVHMGYLKKSGLVVSSRLLKLAVLIGE